MSESAKKDGYGKLTAVCLSGPCNPQRLKEYARSMRLGLEDVVKLSHTYQGILRINNPEKMNIFHVACSISKPDVVEQLVKEGWDVNENDAIRTSIRHGNLDATRRLIDLGGDCISFRGDGVTPMRVALHQLKKEKACLSAVKLLLNAGVDVDHPVSDKLEERAIHVAVNKNMPSVVSYLLQKGGNINIQDRSGSTPLHIAVYKKRFDIIRRLLLHNADMYKENIKGQTPLVSAIAENLKSVIEMFVKKGYDLNRSSDELSTYPLIAAVHELNTDLVGFLIDLGADVNLSLVGCTPLHVVAQKNLLNPKFIGKKCSKVRKEIVELLVEKGANVNIDTWVASPLAASVKLGGSSSLTKLFLNLGANPNVMLDGIHIFFHVICLHSDLIINFLEHGSDYNACNELEITPYHTAMSKEIDVKYVKCFVKHGCPFNQGGNLWNKLSKLCNHDTEMFFKAEIQYFKGIRKNDVNMVTQALEAGAVIGGCSEEMKHPLHFLAEHGYKDVLTCLIKKQHPLNLLNDKGETPLYIAAKHGHYDICTTLLQYGATYNYSSKKCPLTPKEIASASNHDGLVKLFQRVNSMFHLAGLEGGNRMIGILKKRLRTNFDEFLVFVRATNVKGDTLLATAIRKNRLENAKMIMELIGPGLSDNLNGD